MDSVQILQKLTEGFQQLTKWLRDIGFSFYGAQLPWTLGQLSAIILSWLLAKLLYKFLSPTLETRMRNIKGNPHLLRILLILFRRLEVALFALLLWVTVGVMRHVTWPSRSQIVLSAASLATAWLVISTVSRLIRNRSFARFVAITAWIAAALNILDLLPQTLKVLNDVAINFGDFHLSVLTVVKGVVVVGMLLWLASTLSHLAENQVRKADDLTPSLKVLIAKFVRAALYVIAILGGLSFIGVDLTAFAVFSGAIGLGLGFGLQKVVSNLVSGIILLLDKSIKPGDVISVEDTYGRINNLAARYVSVIARDGKEYLIPNEDLITNRVINWSFTSDLVRLDLNFGVSYKANPHKVREVAITAAKGVDRVMEQPLPVCHITEFGDSSINYVLRFWINDPDQGTINIRGNVFLALWDALHEAGIEIPYPHRQVLIDRPIEVVSKRPGAKGAQAE